MTQLELMISGAQTKHETPKYGLIYHASLVGQSAPRLKGKISRVLAAKCALSIRVDALAQSSEPTIGISDREKVEARLRQLEGRAQHKAAGAGKEHKQQPKHEPERQGSSAPQLLTTPKQYATGADVQLSTGEDEGKQAEGEEGGKKKKKKRKKPEEGADKVEQAGGDEEGKKKKKKKKEEKASEE